MGFYELFLIAVGLSMDAFAVAVCKGLHMPRLNVKQGLLIALFFGVFQAVMPLLGWFLGQQFAERISALDHWIAFLLLAFIGGKMIVEALKKDTGTETASKFDLAELLILSVATSIDALAVGITFAFLNVSILPSVCLIGVTTFLLSFAGVVIGHKFGAKYQSKAELLGGVILVLIGTKILLEHLGLIGF